MFFTHIIAMAMCFPDMLECPCFSPASLEGVLAFGQEAVSCLVPDDLWRHLGNVGVEAKEPHPSLGQPEHQLEVMLKKRCARDEIGLACLVLYSRL